jgi:hypothetical protein
MTDLGRWNKSDPTGSDFPTGKENGMECNRIAISTKNLNSIPLKSSHNKKLSGCGRYETD